MKKQHQLPEFIVIDVEHESERFFVASGGIPPYAMFVGKIKPQDQQQDNAGGIPFNGVTVYDNDIINLNW